MRLHLHEVAIGIVGDEFEEDYFPDPRTAFDGRDDALEFLRELTEQDFGADVAKWRAWFAACPQDLLALHYEEYFRKKRAERQG